MSDVHKQEFTYFVGSKEDTGASPTDLWYQSAYLPISCNRCKDILVEYENNSIDVEIQEKNICDIALVDKLVRITIVSENLFKYIGEYIQGYFTVGKVLVDGVVQEKFHALFPTSAARIPIHVDDGWSRVCSTCGRNNREKLFGRQGISRRDLGDRQVFTHLGGGGLHITQRIVDSFSPEMRARLRLRRVPPIPVLD